MTATVAGDCIVGKDSEQMQGDSELLEDLIDEANRSLERLAEVGIQVNQVWEEGSEGIVNAQTESLIRLLPKEEMEDLAQRIHSIESILLEVSQQV